MKIYNFWFPFKMCNNIFLVFTSQQSVSIFIIGIEMEPYAH